jgi:hypothetical protein
VIIDQTALPTASFNLTGGGRTGGIRMGRGTNTLEWITVKGNINGLSAIDGDLLSTETTIKIAHAIVSGGQIGIDIRNRLAEHSGRIIHAEISNNEILENQAGFGTGIAIQNANGANGAVINVSMKENYIHTNRVGFRAFSNAATSTVNNGTVNVISHADRIEGNGMGMYINGGLTQVASAFANGNQTHLEFYGSMIRNNNRYPCRRKLNHLKLSYYRRNFCSRRKIVPVAIIKLQIINLLQNFGELIYRGTVQMYMRLGMVQTAGNFSRRK